MLTRIGKGKKGEALAEEHLLEKGYEILARNYRCKGGEVDLVARDGGTLVFVEVRSRTQTGVEAPLESITRRKQNRLATGAQHYLYGEAGGGAQEARFDVVAVIFEEGGEPTLEHVPNAFDWPAGRWQ